MIIKKFVGKSEPEAMNAARSELGENIVVMNIRTLKKKGIFGIFKPQQTEVTVALEDDGDKYTPKPMISPELVAATDQFTAGAQQPERTIVPLKPVTPEMMAEVNEALAKEAQEQAARKETGSTIDLITPEEAYLKATAAGREAASGSAAKAKEEPRKMSALERLSQKTEEKEPQQPKEAETKNIAAKTQTSQTASAPRTQEDLTETGHTSWQENVKQTQTSTPQEEQQKQKLITFMKLLYNTMLDNEVIEKYANQILDETDRNLKPDVPMDYILAGVYQKMILKFGKPSPITPAANGPKVVFFVGPTGVGKTTTIAKIASKFSVEQKKKVALLTADTYRIAAAEQLHTYANILETPFRIIYTAEEVEASLRDFASFDYILVDTAGHSQQNVALRENMTTFIHAVDGLAEREVFLVVSATTKYRDLLNIADSYNSVADYKLIFTKLDETVTLGNLYNLKQYTGASMSYITCGQNVPDDMEVFDPQKTVKQILGGKN
ncbi:MAG: flagellar biosynthesis protein FlhF [Lachnospiraceae bacterium]|nr:flagellar biosynthesis protein FlhF [Lachnospiraceae bacterium]